MGKRSYRVWVQSVAT